MISDFTSYVKEFHAEFMDTMCGKLLGQGVSRQVYECRHNHDAVLKLKRWE